MHLNQSGSLRSILWPVYEACTVGLFEYLSTLMLICAQSGRVSGLVKKTDPASSSWSDKKGPKDSNNRLLVIVNKFFYPFWYKKQDINLWGARQCCTVVTLHRTAKFRVKHLNSDIEQTRRGIVLLILLFMPPIILLLYHFSVKNTVKGPVFRVKIAIF